MAIDLEKLDKEFDRLLESFTIEELREYFKQHREGQIIENEAQKEFCQFTVNSSKYCSRYHDCSLCDMKPKQND